MWRCSVTVLLALVTTALNAGDEFWQGTEPPGRSSRTTVAERLATEARKMAASVPTLSPSQQEWVRVEITDAIDSAGNRYTPKALNAMDSKEYDIFVAKPRMESLATILERIASGRLSQRDEVVLWAEATVYLSDSKLWQAVDSLVSRGVVDAALLGEHRRLFFHNQAIKAHYITARILVPYLKGRLPR